MIALNNRYRIVYCTPALYMAGGVERVLTLKANYFSEQFGYEVFVILTEGMGKPFFYKLSDKVKVINLNIGFEEMWHHNFFIKVFVYLIKQRQYKRKLTKALMQIRPDFTVSMLRREINFVTKICDGSKKIGELHVNRLNYRNFEELDSNFFKKLFAKFWMQMLLKDLRKLDKFVVLTEEDKKQWSELNNVISIPDPLTFYPKQASPLKNKRIVAVGRYVYQKGFDLLLKSWSFIEKNYPDWELVIYGLGDRKPYENLKETLKIDGSRCHLYGPTSDIQKEYQNSSIFALSSRFEGFGMVVVEAMACGLPVVSYNCPCGPSDIISDQEDGILVKNTNVEEFSFALSKLMENDLLRIQMSQAGRRNVERYRIEHIADNWKELFNELYE